MLPERGAGVGTDERGENLDLSSEQRTQLTPELVDAADKVVVMAERETWPDYLVEGGKVEFWDDRGRLQYSHERRSWHQRPDQS